jgi:hypothetical protein
MVYSEAEKDMERGLTCASFLSTIATDSYMDPASLNPPQLARL